MLRERSYITVSPLMRDGVECASLTYIVFYKGSLSFYGGRVKGKTRGGEGKGVENGAKV